ncbi:nucleoside triphosphate hydrolase [Pseudorhodobacter sp. E13]|uniref:nucleoside triphosphate hydrolase n=1 Tax=Pseudorhodobacter sp. E13 TaxID=2487931 RepID=UPI000F8E302B|nr:nucleoside triphosphate hydrolase [Pseudorhodobacter sp. E13]RUS58646.1 nucleoside triphosphate hydrolase [Pseudorhodobacter sp. E13]
MTKDIDQITAAIAALPQTPGQRVLVAVAGPPGAGKSTLAEAIAAQVPGAVVVPMDGFHLDNAILDARGLRPRKGAPETFDVAGFAALLARLKAEPEVIIPRFDRARDLAVAGAAVVGPADRILIVEGNYLLLQEAPWRDLARFWDVTVQIAVPMVELEARLIARWRGFGLSEAAARARALGNDIPNARRVLEQSGPADICVTQGDT